MKMYIIFLLIMLIIKFIKSWEIYQNSKNYFHSGFWEYCSKSSREKKPKSFDTFTSDNYKLPGFIFHPDEPINLYDTQKSLNCTFIIKAPHGKKLFGVIQSMKFDKFCKGHICDSIEFKTDVNQFGPYYGIFDKNNKDISWIDKFSDYNYLGYINKFYKNNKFGIYSNNGEIQVTILYSKESIQQKYYNNLVIVFTVYNDCDNDINEESKIGAVRIDGVCLNRKFICDGIQNCKNEICDDEKNCAKIIYDIVFIVAIIILFIIGIICLINKIYNRLRQFNQQSDLFENNNINPHNLINQQVSIISSTNNCTSVEPPPSYESLFGRQ